MAASYVSSLPEELCTDLTQNSLIELGTIWGQISESSKWDFCEKYGQIASLIPIKIEEPLIRVLSNSVTTYTDVLLLMKRIG